MIKEVFSLYNRNWLPILIWSLLLIVPITTFSFIGILYLFDTEGIQNPTYLAGCLLVLNYALAIPPFIKLVQKDELDETMSVLEGLQFFLKQFGFILLVSVVVYVMGLIGMYLLFIPTILAVLFLLIFPFFSELKSIKDVIRQTFKKIKDENISLIGDLFVIIGLNVAIWTGIMMFLEQYDNNVLAFLLIRNVMNIFILPILYIYLSLRYRKNDIVPV
jgi:hypothetical protein